MFQKEYISYTYLRQIGQLNIKKYSDRPNQVVSEDLRFPHILIGSST